MMDPHWLAAYAWLCKQRTKAPPNADVWHLRWRWPDEGAHLYSTVIGGRYRLSPMLIRGRGKDAVALWSAADALVLKWVALRIDGRLPRPAACMHLKGGGCRRSLHQVATALGSQRYAFVHRTDIRGYYAHIRKAQAMALVGRYVAEPVLQELIRQYLYYSVEDGGVIHTPQHGIPRGCALSPQIGGALLKHIDEHFSARAPGNLFYTRYMDDFLLFTRSRWRLRRSIAQLADYLALDGFERHPDKTQTGRVASGFDWLGVWFCPAGPRIAPRALEHYRARRLRLYEQALRRGATQAEAVARVQVYDTRWNNWAQGLLNICGL